MLVPLQDVPGVPDPTEASEVYREVFLPAGKFLLGFLVIYLVGRWFVQPAVLKVVRRRNRGDPTIQSAIERYLRLAIVLTAIGFATAAAGYSQVLARSALIFAAATLAVGVAGQEVIGALISGLFLVADPNFGVGDWIAWDDNEGVVEAISFRVTRVRTPNNETITVPNTELTTSSIVRPYSRQQHRLTETVGVGYDADVEAAMARLREAVEANRAVIADPEPRVHLTEFGDDAVVLEVAYWIRNPTRRDILRIRSEVATEIKTHLEAAGFDISPPAGRELDGRIEVENVDGRGDDRRRDDRPEG